MIIGGGAGKGGGGSPGAKAAKFADSVVMPSAKGGGLSFTCLSK
jgi:hypothetical protein